MGLPLSLLDVISRPTGVSASQALRNSLELARLADTLGYTRYWYAEHHNMAMIASTTPEIMIGVTAELTRRIRVGAGGVMLPNHTPLKVAEAYKLLEALHPGRIDLGIGRAPGTDQVTALALRGSRDALAAEDFPARLAELMAFGRGRLPQGHPLHRVQAMPADGVLPPIWLLGSSGFSAKLAAMLGTGFGFAAHFSELPPEGPMLDYRAQFFEQGAFAKPHAIVTLSVVCAESDAEAERQAASLLHAFVQLRATGEARLLPPDEAIERIAAYSPFEQALVSAVRSRQVVGAPDTVKARIEAIAEATSADEVMVSTMTFDHAARLRSAALLAEAFGLERA